jgi:hypothetical protein
LSGYAGEVGGRTVGGILFGLYVLILGPGNEGADVKIGLPIRDVLESKWTRIASKSP